MLVKEGNAVQVIFFLFLFMASCTNRTTLDKYLLSQFNSYKNEYSIFQDSLNCYRANSLKGHEYLNSEDWQIDSLVVMDSHKEKLIAIVLVSGGIGYKGKSDCAIKYLGKKINGNWYFFEGGGTLIVPRDLYGKDEMHPLSFHELSQIARKEMFGENALIKKDGQYIPNDAWIEEHFYNNGYGMMGWTPEKNRAQYDSVHWHYIIDKWNHKFDSTEFKKEPQNP